MTEYLRKTRNDSKGQLLELEVGDDVAVELEELVAVLHLGPDDDGPENRGELVPEPLREQLVEVVQEVGHLLERFERSGGKGTGSISSAQAL